MTTTNHDISGLVGDEVRISIHWKGTALTFPTTSFIHWENVLQMMILKREDITPLKVEEFIDTLNQLRDPIVEYLSIHPMDNGILINQETFLRRVYRTQFPYGFDHYAIIIFWTTALVNLIKYGFIEQDDKNTIQIMQLPDGESLMTVLNDMWAKQCPQKVCGICKIPATKKCPICPQRYCCIEHQRQDWKSHKLTHK